MECDILEQEARIRQARAATGPVSYSSWLATSAGHKDFRNSGEANT